MVLRSRRRNYPKKQRKIRNGVIENVSEEKIEEKNEARMRVKVNLKRKEWIKWEQWGEEKEEWRENRDCGEKNKEKETSHYAKLSYPHLKRKGKFKKFEEMLTKL